MQVTIGREAPRESSVAATASGKGLRMPAKRFHLGWFMNFALDEWTKPFTAGGSPWTGDFYIDMAKALERACFDYIMLEDTLMISDAYGHSSEAYLKHAIMVP